MKIRTLSSLGSLLALGSLLVVSQHLAGQVLPNLGNTVQDAVQTAVDRQVEQAQNAAVERAVEQAEAAAANQALERAQAVQADLVQSQALEQVQSQVERVQGQATEQAQATIERVQAQIETAQSQIEAAQSVISNAQNQIDQVQAQLGQLPEQATERLQGRVPELAPGVNESVNVPGNAAAAAVAGAVPDDAQAAAAPDAAQGPQNQTPQRVTINAADGSPAFVDITLEPGVRAVEFEWVMIVTPDQRTQLDAQAAELLSYLTDTQPFALADDGELLTFTVPPDLDANDAILDLVPDGLRDLIDRNHIYDTQDDDGAPVSPGAAGLTGAAALTKDAPLSLPMPAVCAEPIKLGMIDSGIDTKHAAFAASAALIQQRSFVDAKLSQPSTHGTAVAGLLVGRDDSEQSGISLHPLLPAASLYSAAVFHEQEGAQQGATVMRVLNALNWLMEQDEVRVINMSLAGPPNRLLAKAIADATAQGKVIVAAAGNDGPFGPVRYPAAYEEAIGVTAVARDRGIFRFANQGPHIDYAALGVEVPTALGSGGFGPESGTSLAAPIVSAFIACALAQGGDLHDLQEALAALDARVMDLGVPGADPVFGRGLLHP
jgi:minor extracellular protease Epr